MSRGRRMTLLALTVLSLGLSGCAGTEIETEPAEETSRAAETEPADAKVISMGISGSLSGDTKASRSLLEYADKLEEWSGGSLRLEIYGDGELGSDAELLAGVRQGTVGIHQGSNTALASQFPELCILETPGIYASLEEFNRVFSENGEVFALLQEVYREEGYYLMNIYSDEFRQVTSNVPVSSVSDLAQLRMRTMENEYQMSFWETLGVTAVPYSFTELYLSLEQGVVNAAEGSLNTSIVPLQLYDVQDYLILTNHMPNVMVTTVNLDLWESLTEDQQALLRTTFNGLREARIDAAEEEEEELLELCQEHGMTILYPDAELKGAIDQAGRQSLENLREQTPGDLLDVYLNAIHFEEE